MRIENLKQWQACAENLFKRQDLDENSLENVNSLEEDEISPPVLKDFDSALTGRKDQKAPRIGNTQEQFRSHLYYKQKIHLV